MPGAPNPEAIAWYLQRSEALLGELRERIQALRSRGGQIAGFSGAVLALAGANADSVLGTLHGAARDLVGGSLLLGLLLLVLALVTVLRGTVLPGYLIGFSPKEVANYVTERFINESDLWRVHLRTIFSLQDAIEATMRQGDEAERSVKNAEYFFLSGLFMVGSAFATLIVVVTF